ncbi:hypothetical protein M8J76_003805 [Diaphorina citri]|nr:hypothetical protein M8J76_003805 [Diaphorina citri]
MDFSYTNYLKFMDIDPKYVENKYMPQYVKIKLYRKSVAGGRGVQLFLDRPDTFANFDPELPTKVIVHGFVAGAETSQVTRIRDAYLLSYDTNVITVDWSIFAGTDIDSSDQYILAIAFMNDLVAPFLTRLDPALPGYSKGQTENRLAPTDASFVEVIHTNIGEYGEDWASGTVDYYINSGGPTQPHTHPEDKASNHAYSYIVYSQAIESYITSIEGIKCASDEMALQGRCAIGTKARIGDRNATPGVYLVNTIVPWST